MRAWPLGKLPVPRRFRALTHSLGRRHWLNFVFLQKWGRIPFNSCFHTTLVNCYIDLKYLDYSDGWMEEGVVSFPFST